MSLHNWPIYIYIYSRKRIKHESSQLAYIYIYIYSRKRIKHESSQLAYIYIYIVGKE